MPLVPIQSVAAPLQVMFTHFLRVLRRVLVHFCPKTSGVALKSIFERTCIKLLGMNVQRCDVHAVEQERHYMLSSALTTTPALSGIFHQTSGAPRSGYTPARPDVTSLGSRL